MNAVQFLNSLTTMLQNGPNQDRPSFDGSSALQFMADFESWCALHGIADNAKLGELCKCITSPDMVTQIRQECVERQANGNYAPKSWADVRDYFRTEFGIGTDADDMIKKADANIHHASSYMRSDETIMSFSTRFNFLIQQLSSARDAWNTEHTPQNVRGRHNIAQWITDHGYPPVTEKEKNSWFLERLNLAHYEYAASKFKAHSSTWAAIISDLKKRDNNRLRAAKRFRVPQAPTSALNSAVHPDRRENVSNPPDTPDPKIQELEEKLKTAEKALLKERTAHELTRQQSVKGKSFTPANSVSTTDQRCTLCSRTGHMATACSEKICARCAEDHREDQCDGKKIDFFCDFCTNLGHLESVCPYRYTGLLPWMRKRTRNEAVKAYI